MSRKSGKSSLANNPCRIVIADDHVFVRSGLRHVLNAQDDMLVVGEAENGEEAVKMAFDLKPDVVVTDLSMPGMDGAEVTRRILQDIPGAKVLALTVHEEKAYITHLLQAGASGYILKRTAASELVTAIRSVMQGGTYIDSSIAATVVTGFLEADAAGGPGDENALSDREKEVLVQIAKGFSNKEIAASLRLSIKTVETYKTRAAEKLNLKSRVDIVRYVAQQGWIRA